MGVQRKLVFCALPDWTQAADRGRAYVEAQHASEVLIHSQRGSLSKYPRPKALAKAQFCAIGLPRLDPTFTEGQEVDV